MGLDEALAWHLDTNYYNVENRSYISNPNRYNCCNNPIYTQF